MINQIKIVVDDTINKAPKIFFNDELMNLVQNVKWSAPNGSYLLSECILKINYVDFNFTGLANIYSEFGNLLEENIKINITHKSESECGNGYFGNCIVERLTDTGKIIMKNIQKIEWEESAKTVNLTNIKCKIIISNKEIE